MKWWRWLVDGDTILMFAYLGAIVTILVVGYVMGWR